MTPHYTEPIALDCIDSTNLYVREHFDEIEDGRFVTARFQTAGRGRLGRKWLAEPGANCTGTFALKQMQSGFHAGCIVSLAALDAVREAAPELDCYLKWPNDIYIGKAKLAGMLGEGVIRNGKLAGVAYGIGLNINASPESLENVGQNAISLKIAAKREFNVDFFAKRLAKLLFRYYIIYLNSADEIFDRWKHENRLIGKHIILIGSDGVHHDGIFADIAPAGEMLLDSAGRIEKFNCGDVSIDKSSI